MSMKAFALYITCFNQPESAGRLLAELSGVPGFADHDLILSDQSTDPVLRKGYLDLAKQYGGRHVVQEHLGATMGKRQVVEHAVKAGYEYLSQISEDFELTTEETRHGAFVSGAQWFLEDALRLLQQVQQIPFVHWTCIRGGDGFGYLPGGSTPMGNRILRLPGMRLAYIMGDVALWNWPYTGRVAALALIWKHGTKLVPGCDSHRKWAEGGGGEWKQQWVSQGHGACLLAHPVRHRDREKPEGSLP